MIAALTPSWTAAQRVNHIKGTVTPHTQSVGAWSTTGGNINPAGAVQALNLAAPPLTATSLGQDGHDYIGSGAGSTGPDGYQDIHITLTGLPSSKTISWIDVTGLGAGEWRYNGAYGSDKAVLVNYAAGGTTADLYLQPYQNETGRPFTVTVFYTDSTSANGTTNLVYATAHLPMPSGLVDRTNETGGTITARGENGAGEGAAKAFDNNINTKWLDLSGNSWIQYQFANNAAYVITQYTLTSAADTASYPGRAPKSWVLKGSNDGVTWTTLDTRTNQADTANLDTRTYNFTNATAFKIYKLDSIASNGDGIIQLAEIRLKGPTTSPLVDRTNETGGTITARGENGAGEGAAKAFDNNINTKWLDLSGNSWIQYQFANNAAYVITQYTLTSAADTASYPGRAPKSWVLKGSNDGVTWTTLDTRTNQADTANLDTRTYNFNNTTAYKMYRLDNIVSNGDSIIQLAEFRLLGP